MRISFMAIAFIGCSSTPERTPQSVASARAYCELSADAFCRYYQRCDRMAATSHSECVATFSQACEDSYEPHYVALEDRGDLLLSAPGLAECAEHLRTVACDQQIFDLDGACGQVWVGQAEDGAACGLGIESFVCAPESTCVLGLNFCGTCEPTVPTGSACEPGIRCADGTSCIDGTCLQDASVGEDCSLRDCVSGARCTDDVCVRNAVVGVGEDCDVANRCQYRAACVSGTCVQTALHGEDCSDALPCASGWCDETCQPLKDAAESCTTGRECVSGVCDGTCGELPGVCFEE